MPTEDPSASVHHECIALVRSDAKKAEQAMRERVAAAQAVVERADLPERLKKALGPQRAERIEAELRRVADPACVPLRAFVWRLHRRALAEAMTQAGVDREALAAELRKATGAPVITDVHG